MDAATLITTRLQALAIAVPRQAPRWRSFGASCCNLNKLARAGSQQHQRKVFPSVPTIFTEAHSRRSDDAGIIRISVLVTGRGIPGRWNDVSTHAFPVQITALAEPGKPVSPSSATDWASCVFRRIAMNPHLQPACI
jgi:hypothetical protein